MLAYHHSRIKKYRLPQGAVMCGAAVTLCLRLSGEDSHYALPRLRLWACGKEELIDGRLIESTGNERLFCFSFDAPQEPQLVWYYFIIDNNGNRLYYGARSGEGTLSHNVPLDYQITVYSRDFKTPEWFKETIVYQIFPDRFCMGARDMLGRNALDRLDYHVGMNRPVVKHRCWSEKIIYSKQAGEKHYTPCDYYGGDINGIIEKLPYLASLGVGCIYLNPIFEAASNHRYNTANYLALDPVLGNIDDARRLCEAARASDIRVMLDGVFSHTGDDSIYFNRHGNYPNVGAYQSMDSPYYDWYDFSVYPSKYRCWWGFESLPEINEHAKSYIDFIRQVLHFWAKVGFTSWRLDVADELPDSFIAMLRKELKAIDADAVLLGEVWEDASNKLGANGLREYVYGSELDSVMNYPFMNAVLDFLSGAISAHALLHQLSAQRERYPEPFYRSCMNILSSHDTYRALSRLSGAPPKDSLSREEQASFAYLPSALANGKWLMRLAALIQFSMPQPPCIYYGDEAGVLGLSDPFNRSTYPWGNEDESLVALYRLLGENRKSCECLKCGATCFAAISERVFAIQRIHNGNSVLCVVNASSLQNTVFISCESFLEGNDADLAHIAQCYEDALTNRRFYAQADEAGIILALEPFEGLLLKSKADAE